MSSFQDYERCPQCGGVYEVNFNYRTFEGYKFCDICGKMEKHSVMRDGERNLIFDEKGERKYLIENKFGYGCFAIVSKQSGTTIHYLNKPVDLEKIKAQYLKLLKNPDVISEMSYLTYWDVEKERIIDIFGTAPEMYGQYEKCIDK